MNRQPARPDTVLKRADELVAVGQSGAALQALHDLFGQRRIRQVSVSQLEPLVLRFIDLAVEQRKGRVAKDGLVQFKNIAQGSPASIEAAITHFLKLSNARVHEAQQQAATDEHVDDLEQDETPESMLLAAVSVEEDRDRRDRVMVVPWLKFLWEAYRTALDILKNNSRLELVYHNVAHRTFKFCLAYQRKTEFRRLCELLRQHVTNATKYSSSPNALNLTDPDTLQRHLDIRFAQLNAAVELELWQEAFRSVEDIHSLLTSSKKQPRLTMMANYYEKLARIFLVSDNSLLHAASWNRYHALVRAASPKDQQLLKAATPEEQRTVADNVLLSALAVPVITSAAPGTGNLQRARSDFLIGNLDVDSKTRAGRLNALLGLQRTPTRAGLLRDALGRNVQRVASPHILALYRILEQQFHPLSICADAQPILDQIAQSSPAAAKRYIPALHNVILTRLFQQLSQVYEHVTLKKVLQLVSPLKTDASGAKLSEVDIEKFALNACKRGHLALSIDHASSSVTFQDDLFDTDRHPSIEPSAAAAGSDSVRLQSTPDELVRTQLSRLAFAIDRANDVLHPGERAAADAQKRQAAFEHAVEVAQAEHEAAVARKELLAHRKELVRAATQQREHDEAVVVAARAKAQAEQDAQRAQADAVARERARIAKELEAVRIGEARKMAQSLREKGGLKLEDKDIDQMDPDTLVKLQVEQIERENKEKNERLKTIHRKMDHLERAYRRAGIKHQEEDYAAQQAADRKAYEHVRTVALEAARAKHQADVETRDRLVSILPDYRVTRARLEEYRAEALAARRDQAKAQCEKEKAKYRASIIAQRKAELQNLREEERLEAEAEARRKQQEEEERAAEEKRQAAVAERRARFEAEQKEREAAAAKQREREAEAEARAKARRAGSAAAPSAPSAGGGAWRAPSTPSPSGTGAGAGGEATKRWQPSNRFAVAPPSSADSSPASAPSEGAGAPGKYVPPVNRGAYQPPRGGPFGPARSAVQSVASPARSPSGSGPASPAPSNAPSSGAAAGGSKYVPPWKRGGN